MKRLWRFTGTTENVWRRFRERVFKRDGGKCRICGSREFLRGAHVEPVKNHPEMELWESNVITLCAVCDARYGDDLVKNRHLWEKKVVHRISRTQIDAKGKRQYSISKVANNQQIHGSTSLRGREVAAPFSAGRGKVD